MQFIGIRILWKRIKAIRFMMKDKTVRMWKKALIVFGIIYLFLPLDLIPPVVPILGFLDDVLLWILILYLLKDQLDTYWMGEKPVDYSKRYKDAMDADDFEVVDEKKDDAGKD